MEIANLEDALTLAEMSRDLVEVGLAWQWQPSSIVRQMRRKDTEVVVAKDQHEILGFAIMRFRDDDAHLLLLAVARSEQRKGIGKLLLEWLEASARTAGTFLIHLEVRAEQRGARAFYRAVGYRERGQIERYYQSRESAVLMTKDLRSMREAPRSGRG